MQKRRWILYSLHHLARLCSQHSLWILTINMTSEHANQSLGRLDMWKTPLYFGFPSAREVLIQLLTL